MADGKDITWTTEDISWSFTENPDNTLAGGASQISSVRKTYTIKGEGASSPLGDSNPLGDKNPLSDKNPLGDSSGSKDDTWPNCKNTGVTDAGLQRSARIKGAINAMIIGVNTYTALKIAEMQHALAKDWAGMAEWYRNYYYDNFHPIEKQLIEEVSQDPLYERNKANLVKGQMVISAKLPFVGKLEEAVACTGRYCTGQRQSLINDILIEQATVESMICGLSHRYIDDEETVRNNRRWERRNQVIKLGRDMPTESVTYAQMATGIYGQIGRQAASAAESASWALGYNGERVETKYPERRGALTIPNYVSRIPHVPDLEPNKVSKLTAPDMPQVPEKFSAEITITG